MPDIWSLAPCHIHHHTDHIIRLRSGGGKEKAQILSLSINLSSSDWAEETHPVSPAQPAFVQHCQRSWRGQQEPGKYSHINIYDNIYTISSDHSGTLSRLCQGLINLGFTTCDNSIILTILELHNFPFPSISVNKVKSLQMMRHSISIELRDCFEK